MNADQVVDKIISDAQSEADQVKSQANQEIEKIKEQTEKKLESFKEETETKAKEAAEDKAQRMMASARMDASKEKLKTKRELIDRVFDKAAETIKNLDESAYNELMEKLMLKAVETGSEQVIPAEGENRINAEFVKNINGKLGDDKKSELTLSEHKCKGQAGFMLKRGNVSTNVTLNVLIEQARDKLETEISNKLFA